MQQSSFNFGPSHNIKDPNTSTASSSGMDDLVSKLSSLLMVSNNKDQLENTLKKAVKDGIIEANKEDVRVSDSEERDAERRHKELMQHLNKIAAFGRGDKHQISGTTQEEKEKDGFTLFDALKWGGIAAGVLTLVSNLDSLVKVFGETTNTISSLTTQVDGFSGTIKKITDNAFSKEGAIGMLLGAFVPGGLIAKALFAILGGNISSAVLSTSNSGTNTGSNSNGTTGIPIAGQPNNTTSSITNTLGNYNVNNMGAIAGVIAGKSVGGGGLTKFGVALGTYLATEHLDPELDENGNPRQSLYSKAKNGALDIYNRTTWKDISQGAEYGLAGAGIGAAAAAKLLPKNKWGIAAAGLGAAVTGYDYGNENIDIINSVKNINSLPTLPNMTTMLGITAPENEYNKRLKQYEDKISELKQELAKTGIGTSISSKEYKALPAQERSQKRKEFAAKQTELKTQIKELEASKEEFNKEVDINNNKIIGERLLLQPDNPDAGVNKWITSTDIKVAGAVGGIAATVTAFSGPGALAAGATSAAGVLAGSAAFNTVIANIEQYILTKYNKKVDVLSLAITDSATMGNILIQYANENPFSAAGNFALLAGGVFSPIKGIKALAKIAANIKNIKNFGYMTNIDKAAGVTTKGWNLNIAQGAGKELGKVAAISGLGAASAYSIANQNDILGNPKDVLTKTNNNLLPQVDINVPLQSPINPSAIPNNPANVDTNTQNTSSYPSGIPYNPSGTSIPVDTAMFSKTGDLLSGKRAAGHVDVANLNADYATNLANFIKDAEKAFGDKIEISSAYRPPTQKEKDALRSTATTQEYLYNNRDPNGAPVAKPYSSNHGFGDASDIYLKKFRSANGMNTMTPEQLKQWKALAAQHQLNIGDKFGENWHVYGDNGKGSKGLKGEEYANYISQNSLSSAIGGNYSGELGPMGNLIGQILRTESKGNPNSYWGDASGDYKDLLGGKQLSEMTFDELKEFQKNLTRRTKGHVPDTDKGTSAAGIGQWVGKTLFGEGYNDTGFLKDYFGHANYGNEKFDLDRQKDMFKTFLKSKKYGNLEGFMAGEGTVDSYAAHLGGQWQGVQKPEEQAKLKATLTELRKTPDLNIDQALNKVMSSMSNLSEKTGDFKKTFDGLAKQVGDSLNSITDFLTNVGKKAGELLPKEFKDLFDIPAMKEFLDPFLGGESKSTLAHPKRTFTSLESKELKDLLLGTSEETGESSDVKTYPYDRTKVNIVANPNISGEQLAANSSALKLAEQKASQQGLGSIINMSSGNGGEAIHGQQIAGLSGNINTHFPGDIDAISARIYQWTDAPMFYASGKLA